MKDDRFILKALKDTDLDEVIGGDNVSIFIWAERVSKTKCTVRLTKNGQLIGGIQEYKIIELPTKLHNKRTPIVQTIIDVIDKAEDMSDITRHKLREFCGEVHQKWIVDNPSVKTAESADPSSADTPPDITEEDEIEALEFLRNPKILEIVNEELGRTIKGEERNRMFLFLGLVMSYTKEYPAITVVGESSIGKTYTVNEILRIFPEENRKKYGRLSKTVLERATGWDNVKILYVQESRGSRASSDAIRLASSSDGGMVAYITDRETGKPMEYPVQPMTVISTQTELTLHHEDETRNFKVYLDSSIKQTTDVLSYQAEEAEYPDDLRTALGWVKPSKENLIKNAIRLLRKDIDIVIPYMSIIAPLLNKSRMRIKRDHKRIIGAIKASAFLHQYQRETLTIGDKTWIVANEEDFKIAWLYGEKPFAQSFYNVDDDSKAIIEIIRNLEKDWQSQAGGVHTDDIVDDVHESLGRGRTWTTDRLKVLREDSKIRATWKEANDHQRRGFYYGVYVSEYSSILNGDIPWKMIHGRTQEWRDGLESEDVVFSHLV